MGRVNTKGTKHEKVTKVLTKTLTKAGAYERMDSPFFVPCFVRFECFVSFVVFSFVVSKHA
jgi:hypothetical protein